MNKVPKVSVLVPTYNYGEYLDDCIQSILNQTFSDFELIIGDNASTDNTEEIVSKYLGDSRVRYIKNPANLGLVKNLNNLLHEAKGHYIKLLCSDDKFHPQLLEKFVAAMESNPSVVLISSYYQFFGIETEICKAPFTGLQNGGKIVFETLKDKNWLGFPSNVMFRTSACAGLEFNSAYSWIDDWDYYARLLRRGDCYIIPEVLSYLRTHPGQLSYQNFKNYAHYLERYDFFTQFRTNEDYSFSFPKKDLDRLIRKQAYFCAITLRKALPGMNKKGKRALIRKAFSILRKEGILIRSLLTPGSKMLQKDFLLTET